MQMLLEKRISEEQWKVLYQKYEKLRGYLMEDPPDFQKIADADIEFPVSYTHLSAGLTP